MRLRYSFIAFVLLLATAAPAAAKSNVLWHGQTDYNAIAADISGVPDMDVTFEDDWAEWTVLTGTDCAAGGCVIEFTVPTALPGAVETCDGSGCYGYTYNPTACAPITGGICIALYHRIYLVPGWTQAFFGLLPLTTGASFQYIWTRLQAGTQDPAQAAGAIMTFIHESYHNRLMSGDEGLVNACALRDFGYWLSRDFQIPATVTTTVMVPEEQSTTRNVAYYRRVRVAHHRRLKNGTTRTWYTYKKVLRHKAVTSTATVQVPQDTTGPNPLYQTLVADAQAFYQAQPYPYNAGTCTAAPIT